jgi:hypothetical protein
VKDTLATRALKREYLANDMVTVLLHNSVFEATSKLY